MVLSNAGPEQGGVVFVVAGVDRSAAIAAARAIAAGPALLAGQLRRRSTYGGHWPPRVTPRRDHPRPGAAARCRRRPVCARVLDGTSHDHGRRPRGGRRAAVGVRTPARGVLLIAGILGVGVAVLNPFVQASGDLILFQLPEIPIFDMQVTLEEVMAGLTLGARAAAVTIVVMAVLALADPDRLLQLASRLAPRSALAASVAARMVPTLRRDAVALVETSRLRGRSPRVGSWVARGRTASTLALPLVGSALERSLDVAEAMAARAATASAPPRVVPEWRGTPSTGSPWPSAWGCVLWRSPRSPGGSAGTGSSRPWTRSSTSGTWSRPPAPSSPGLSSPGRFVDDRRRVDRRAVHPHRSATSGA